MLGKRSDTPAPRLLRVDRSARPGWKTGLEQPPRPGQAVYCTEGMAEVTRILGKTGDGSRLLELRLLEKEAPPFYAAASNVLVMPDAGPASGPAAAAPEAWRAGRNGLAAAAAGQATPIDAPMWLPDPAGADASHAPAGSGAPDPGTPAVLADVSWALDGTTVPPAVPAPGNAAASAWSPESTPPAGSGAGSAADGSAVGATPEESVASARQSASPSVPEQPPGSSPAPAQLPGSEAASAQQPASPPVGAPDSADAADAEAPDDLPLPEIIGTPHGPPGRDADRSTPGAAQPAPGTPPTIPLDPRVHWIR